MHREPRRTPVRGTSIVTVILAGRERVSPTLARVALRARRCLRRSALRARCRVAGAIRSFVTATGAGGAGRGFVIGVGGGTGGGATNEAPTASVAGHRDRAGRCGAAAQAPAQPAKQRAGERAVAVSVTWRPAPKRWTQSVAQPMPCGLLVTVPRRTSSSTSDSVARAAGA